LDGFEAAHSKQTKDPKSERKSDDIPNENNKHTPFTDASQNFIPTKEEGEEKNSGDAVDTRTPRQIREHKIAAARKRYFERRGISEEEGANERF